MAGKENLSESSRLALLSVYFSAAALGLTPLAPLVILQPTSLLVGSLSSDHGHPWFSLPLRFMQPFLLLMVCFAGMSFVLTLTASLLKQEPRRAVLLSLFLSGLAVVIRLFAWDQGFAWREFYRDLGMKE